MTTAASLLGGGAIIAAVAINLMHPNDGSSQTLAGGSGDSATGTSYVSPVAPTMTVGPTAMTLAGTVTATAPATKMATSFAAPTLKATAAPGCVNNGQCP
jgi:small neutral amino acid transporter SnatA (MarC family)